MSFGAQGSKQVGAGIEPGNVSEVVLGPLSQPSSVPFYPLTIDYTLKLPHQPWGPSHLGQAQSSLIMDQVLFPASPLPAGSLPFPLLSSFLVCQPLS